MIDDEPLAPLGYRLGGIWSTTAFVGRGPVGEVYECSRPEVPERLVAKLLPEELLESSEIWSTYLAAVSAAGALPTDATVRHVAFGSDLQLACPFVVTERVTWPSLASRVAQQGPIAPKVWGKTLGALISLFERAHGAGVSHGRLTPTNLFISRDAPAKIKVTDFGVGIACAARAGETHGGGVTGWVGPESEAKDAQPSPAGDIYCLGLLTFFALTGKPLFCAVAAKDVDPERLRSEMSVPLRAASETARQLGAKLDPAFDKWFARTVVPSPDDRYSSVKLLGEAFEHVLRRTGAGPVTAAAATPSKKPATAAPRPTSSGSSPRAAPAKVAVVEKAAPPPPPETTPDDDPLDEQPTIRLSLDKLLIPKQPQAESRAVPVAAIPAPAPVVAAPIVAAPIVAQPAIPVSDALPPPVMWAPAPEATVPVIDAAPVVPETAHVAVPNAAVPSSASANIGAPAAPEPGAKAPLLGRPRAMAVIAFGLVLFGVLMGLLIGGRGQKAEPEALPKQDPADIAKPNAPAVAPARTEPAAATAEIPKPVPSTQDPSPATAPPSATASVSAAPALSASAAPPPTSASSPPSAAPSPPVATTAKPVTPPPAQPAVPTARPATPKPTPAATTAAPKPEHAAPRPPPAKASKKPCGTFINPCK